MASGDRIPLNLIRMYEAQGELISTGNFVEFVNNKVQRLYRPTLITGTTIAQVHAVKIDATRVFLAYTISSNAHGVGVVVTIDNGQITVGQAQVFVSESNTSITCARQIDSTRILIGFSTGSNIKAVVASISGTSVSYGSISSAEADAGTSWSNVYVELASPTVAVCVYRYATAHRIYARRATISGTSVSSWSDDTEVANPGMGNGSVHAVRKLQDNRVIAHYSHDGGPSANIRCRVLDVASGITLFNASSNLYTFPATIYDPVSPTRQIILNAGVFRVITLDGNNVASVAQTNSPEPGEAFTGMYLFNNTQGVVYVTDIESRGCFRTVDFTNDVFTYGEKRLNPQGIGLPMFNIGSSTDVFFHLSTVGGTTRGLVFDRTKTPEGIAKTTEFQNRMVQVERYR